MRRIQSIRLLLFMTVIAMVIPVFSQTHYDGSVYVGAKAGASFSRVFFNPSVSQGMLPGAVAGVTFRYIEEKNFGIVTELNFEQRGWSEKFDGHDLKYHRTLNYFQLLVLAQIFFPVSTSKIFINLGPEIGVMFSDKITSNFNYKDLPAVPNFPANRQIDQLTLEAKKKIDFGISAGLGAEVPVNRRNSLALEGRFYYGLGNVLECGRTETFSAANSMSVMATLTYWFKMK